MIEFQTLPKTYKMAKITEKTPMIYHDIKGYRAAWKVADDHDELEPWFMGSHTQYEQMYSDLKPEETDKFYVWCVGDIKDEWLVSVKEFNETITGREDAKE